MTSELSSYLVESPAVASYFMLVTSLDPRPMFRLCQRFMIHTQLRTHIQSALSS
jgi:hypothetical protein